jgi:hypothetical protein
VRRCAAHARDLTGEQWIQLSDKPYFADAFADIPPAFEAVMPAGTSDSKFVTRSSLAKRVGYDVADDIAG